MENDCQMADLVLPSNTMLEVDDMGVESQSAAFSLVFHEPRAVEARGESMSDYEIVVKIAERFGIADKYTGGKSVEEWIKTGWEHSGCASEITYEELKEKGYYVVPQDPNWKDNKAGMASFVDDPENNPLYTPSGKIEFYSERLATQFPDDTERPPVPGWIGNGESHQECIGGERASSTRCSWCRTTPVGACTRSTTT